jgi:ankyrin repeat protein
MDIIRHDDLEAFIQYMGRVNTAVKKGSAETYLHAAAHFDSTYILKFLLREGVDPNVQDDNGDTPLHEASHYGHIRSARSLLKAHAAVDIRNAENWTPLFRACRGGHKGIAELLIERGADVNARDNDQATPLFFAVASDRADVVRCLIANGSEVNARMNNKLTPLHRVKSKAVAEILVNRDADVNAGDLDGKTILHIMSYGVAGNCKDLLRFLVYRGADVNRKDNFNDTPLHLAAKHGNRQVVELLLSHRANAGAMNLSHRTARQVAQDMGHSEIEELLLGWMTE